MASAIEFCPSCGANVKVLAGDTVKSCDACAASVTPDASYTFSPAYTVDTGSNVTSTTTTGTVRMTRKGGAA